MARSYRKPWIIDGYGSKSKSLRKRWAARRVRNSKEVPNGGAYRKFFDSWNIVDYRWAVSKPICGGRSVTFRYWESEEQMKKAYRKATCK